MTAIIEYNRLPDGGWEAHRIVQDAMYFRITERDGTPVIVDPAGDTVMHLSDLDETYKIYGEIRFD